MKKIVKKTMLCVLIIICLILSVNIIKNFNLYTLRYGIKNINSNKKVVQNKYYLISSSDIYNKEKYISASKMSLFGIASETVYIDLNGNEYNAKSIIKNNSNEDNKYDVYLEEKDEKYGLVDKNENQILPYEFDDITIINENFFIVCIDDEVFLLNKYNDNLGKIVVTDLLESNKIKLNMLNDLNFNKDMNIDEDFIIFEDKLAIRNDNTFVIFDERGKKISNNEYTDFNIISQIDSQEEIAKATCNGKKLLLDNNLNVIYQYDTYEVNRCNNGLLEIQNNGKKGVITLNNSKIVDVQYDEITITDNNYILARKDDQNYIFDYNGKLLFETNDILLTLSDGENFLYKEYDIFLVIIYSIIALIAFIIIVLSIKYILFNKKHSEK